MAAFNTFTAASHLNSSLEHLDGGLDTSTAALTLQQRLDGGLTPRQ
jgi:hypothetical protein